MNIHEIEAIIIINTNKLPLSKNLVFAPSLLFWVAFESEAGELVPEGEEEDGDVVEVGVEVGVESVVVSVAESVPACLKIFAAGESAGSFNKAVVTYMISSNKFSKNLVT